MKKELLTASEASVMASEVHHKQFAEWNMEWEKVQHSIADTITRSANFGHKQTKFNLKEVRLEVVAKNLDYLKHAFTTRGYEVEFLMERSPNGARTMIVKW